MLTMGRSCQIFAIIGIDTTKKGDHQSFKETGQGRAVSFQSSKGGTVQCIRCHTCRSSGEPCLVSMLWMAVHLIEALTAQSMVHMQGAAHTRDAGLRNVTGLQPLCPAADSEYKSQRKLRATTCLPWDSMVIYIATI